ncbi:MAG: hypothetical protein QOD30_1841, partial [Actinomycetota bacterium]|nr:hypothetical protein [Actinomycetota bacterium]
PRPSETPRSASASRSTPLSTPAVRHHHGTHHQVDARRAGEIALRIHLAVYLSVIGLLVVIWIMTGFGYPWPMWQAMSWGVALAIHAGVHKAVWASARD